MAKVKVKTTKGRWENVGPIGVDSGRMMLSDPCYVLPEEDGSPCETQEGEPVTYEAHLKNLRETDHPLVAFPFGSHRAVSVSTGYGDGLYNVQVKYATVEYFEGDKVMRRERRLAEMRIKFL